MSDTSLGEQKGAKGTLYAILRVARRRKKKALAPGEDQRLNGDTEETQGSKTSASERSRGPASVHLNEQRHRYRYSSTRKL